MGRLNEVRGLSLADQACEAIRTAILDGTFAAEERLTIEGLAGELGISRTPVREALKALERDGLVTFLPHRGVVVTPLAREEIRHRYSIRAMLEGFAAELACERDEGELAAALAENCDELAALMAKTTTDGIEAIKPLAALNQDFHRLIREGSGSATLIRLLTGLRNPLAFTLVHWRDPFLRQASLGIHREVAAAFEGRRPSLARQLMERHLLEARDYLMSNGFAPDDVTRAQTGVQAASGPADSQSAPGRDQRC